MALWKVAKYVALAVGLFVLISSVISLLWAILGLLWSLFLTTAILLLTAVLTYVAVKGARWLYRNREDTDTHRGSTADPAESGLAADDPIDELNERYVNGDLTEAEFERRLEHELGGDSRDEIDRELERLHSN